MTTSAMALHDVRCVLHSFLAVLVIASSAFLAPAQNSVSPPVGFIRVEVSSNSQILASSPFHALAPGSVPASVTVLSWDAVSGYTNASETSPTVGRGFWLVNAAATQAVVFLAGEVPLDAEVGVPLAPGLNLIGHPYPSPVGVEATGLDTAALSTADGSAVSTLSPGEGYWYQHAGDQPVVWMEAPYANPFPTNGLPPQIVGLEVIDAGQAVRLAVVPSAQSAPLELYYQDLNADQPFDPLNGWLSAGHSLPTGAVESTWEDHGNATRPPPSAVFGRIYLVAEGDLAQALEDSGETQGLISSGGAYDEAGNSGEDPSELDSGEAGAGDGSPLGSTTNMLPAARLLALDKIIYVDAKRGQDRYSGRAAVVVDAALGPKQTVQGGLAAARPGDTMVVRSGHYRENVNLSGRDLKVRIVGRVNLSGRPAGPPAAPAPLPPPQSMTNTLAAAGGELAGE